jgi:peptidylprolyl isomerase
MASRPRRSTQPAPRHGRENLSLESLEQRRVMAASVAVGAGIGSSPVIRLIDSQTGAVQAQALAFETTFKGGVRVAMGDVDADGTAEVLAASGAGRIGEIRVFKHQAGSTTLIELTAYRTRPFGNGYRGGVAVACGDVDGNGREDIVAAASRGTGTVNVFLSVNAADPVPNTAHRSFTPFGGRYEGGASVAVAELGTFSEGRLLNPIVTDERVEIVVGSGPGMRPTVKAYDLSGTTARVVTTIEPLAADLQGGVAVSTGLFNADNVDDIVVSAGRGGGGVTEVYAGSLGTVTAAPLLRFAAFASLAKPNAPVHTAAVDSDGDGLVDRFLTTQGNGSVNPGVVVSSTSGARVGTFATPRGPLYVAAARKTFPTVTTETGLQFRDIVVGSGITPVVGKAVLAHYTGMLTDGRVFDSSRLRGSPLQISLGVGQVIKGWDEGLATMNVGGRRILTIPANLAYGDSPPAGNIITAGATLIFEVQIVGAQS